MFKTHRTYQLTTGVKNNTIAVINHLDKIEVVYHNTIVVSAKKKIEKAPKLNRWIITLNNGGWDTISTRTVINRALEQLNVPGRLERKKINKVLTTIFKDGENILPFTSNTLELS